MYRVRILAIAACGVALTACTSGSDFFTTAPVTATLRFESEPAGAEVKTSTGQTCRTPCALAVPATDQTASFSLTGFLPQTVPVKLVLPESAGGETGVEGTISLSPDPVYAELEPDPQAKKRQQPARRRPATATAPAAPRAAAPSPRAAAPAPRPSAPPPMAAPPPSQAPAAASPWPPVPAPR